MLYVTVGREGELVTTESSSNKNFIRGAAILAAAGIISRILGALYRIPLANLLGDEGIGLFELAQPLYNFFLTASTAGLPLAISKLVSEKTAVRDERGAMDVFKVALVFLLFTGVLSATVMFTTADWLAGNVYNDPRVALSIKSITPALIFVTVVSAFRGFFQGQAGDGAFCNIPGVRAAVQSGQHAFAGHAAVAERAGVRCRWNRFGSGNWRIHRARLPDYKVRSICT